MGCMGDPQSSAPAPELPALEGVSCPGCNLIVVSVDTLRADHLGAYGYGRDTSPNIDDFAGKSLFFEEAFSHSSFTLSSHASIFTGLYPIVHDAEVYRRTGLNDGLTTLAEVLASNGYEPVSFNGGAAISSDTNINQGFTVYEQGWGFEGNFNKSRDWLIENRSKRFFMFIHGYDVHSPYYLPGRFYSEVNPGYGRGLGEFLHDLPDMRDCHIKYPVESRQCLKWGYDPASFEAVDNVEGAILNYTLEGCRCRVDVLTALYDDGIRYVDERFGDFMRQAGKMGLLEDTVIVFTSDHGEELGERDRVAQHGHRLTDEQIRVPLMIYVPGASARVSGRTEHVDLMPTLLSILDVDYDGVLQGEDLTKTPASDRAYAEYKYLNGEMQVMMAGDLKLMVLDNYGSEGVVSRLFNLSGDPGETQGLLADEVGEHAFGEVSNALVRQTRENERLRKEINPVSRPIGLDDDALERLRRLGYLK